MLEIAGKDHQQMLFSSLEQEINKDNPIRLVDAFVDKLDLKLLGITRFTINICALKAFY